MARSEEAEAWTNAVYSAIQEIPYGKVTSYGHIALLLGEPQRARQVGVCLKFLPRPESGLYYHSGNVPWQRVVNSKGVIPSRGQGAAERQGRMLLDEGIEVKRDAWGTFSVNLAACGWFPHTLPSEEEDYDGDDVEGDEGQDGSN